MVDTSNQIAPLRIKENSALYYLTGFICEMIQWQKQLPKEQQVEIEGRLGFFVPRDLNDAQTVGRLEFIKQYTSLQGMHILNQIDVMRDKYKFESDVEEHKFEAAQTYFENISKVNRENRELQQQKKKRTEITDFNYYLTLSYAQDIFQIEEVQNDLILDMVLEENIRISYYVNTGKFEVMSKESDHNHQRDIIHNGIMYRISAKKETNIPNQDVLELLNKKQVQVFRFKQRKSYCYQFMEISLTRVLQVSKNANSSGYMELVENLQEELGNLQLLNTRCIQFFGRFFVKADPNFCSKKREIEVEIKNLQSFFNDDRKIVEMKLRAFMKNLQAIDMLNEQLLFPEENAKLQSKFGETQRVEFESKQQQGQEQLQGQQFQFDRNQCFNITRPAIGEYMQEEINKFIYENKVPDSFVINGGKV